MNKPSPTDTLSSLLDRLKATPSEEEAWRLLYIELWPFVVATVFRRLKDKGLAEDVAQEVFIRLLTSRPFEQISDPNQFRAYVWKMAVNAANTQVHKSLRKEQDEKALLVWGSSGQLVAAAMSNASDEHLLLEEASAIAFRALGSEERKLLDLVVEGHSLREAADELGLSYSAVGVRLHRLKQKLHNLLIQ